MFIKEMVPPTVYRHHNSTSSFKPFLDFKEMIRFSLSSLFCAVVDIGLFTLILKLLSANEISWALFGATSIARLVSAVANFLINKKIVFESRDSAFCTSNKIFYALRSVK